MSGSFCVLKDFLTEATAVAGAIHSGEVTRISVRVSPLIQLHALIFGKLVAFVTVVLAIALDAVSGRSLPDDMSSKTERTRYIFCVDLR